MAKQWSAGSILAGALAPFLLASSIDVLGQQAGGSSSLLQSMYKVTCSPSIDFLRVERFIVDPLLPRAHIENEVAIANRSSRIGIYAIVENQTRRHRCRLNPGEVVELFGDGDLFNLHYNGEALLVDFTFNPLLDNGRPVLERLSFSLERRGSLELCWVGGGCEVVALNAAEFPLTP